MRVTPSDSRDQSLPQASRAISASRPVWSREPYEFELARLGGCPEAQSRNPHPKPVFIVGHPRSGTNWIANILNLHPRIAVCGELNAHHLLNAMPGLVAEPHCAGFHEPMRSTLARGFQDLIRASMSSAASVKAGAEFIADHTPRPLRPMLPEACYVVIARDGRDVAVSLTVHRINCNARRAVLRFIGAEADLLPAFATDPRTIPGYSENSPASHYRSGKVGQWRERLTGNAAKWLAQEAGQALAALGYETDDRWTSHAERRETRDTRGGGA